jgi:hypothetical protein
MKTRPFCPWRFVLQCNGELQRERSLKTLNITVMVTLAVLLIGAAASCGEVRRPEPSASNTTSGVLQAARQVVEAFKAKSGKRLATLVHTKKGVRFSPSAYVDIESDVVFSRTQISTF